MCCGKIRRKAIDWLMVWPPMQGRSFNIDEMVILHGKSLRQIWIWNVSVTKVHTPYGESYNPIVTHHIFLVVVCVCFVRLANALQNAINQYRIELQQ